MKTIATSSTKTSDAPKASILPTRKLQRKCACGAHSSSGEECSECQSKKKLQRRAVEPANSPGLAPPIVHDVLRTPGQPLDHSTQGFMGARFGHDFSNVRVHTDSTASASAEAVGATAYTVDQHIVFRQGAYSPKTPDGLHLVAHELTHVVQQSRSSISSGTELGIESSSSAAEYEADRMATSVLTPGATPSPASAHSTGLNRSLGWTLLGGLVGGIIGGLLGALAGPIGAVLGAVAGAALGSWITGASTNSQTDTGRGEPWQRIHRLLGTDIGDWVVTDEEALQALTILQMLDKRDPVELLKTVTIMKGMGDWQILRKELSPVMQLSLDYFEQSACHPDHGYIMPGDQIHLEFYIPGHARHASGSSGEKKNASYEARISGDYNVGEKGVRLPDMEDEIPIVGKSLKDAATLIAEAYTDPLWTYTMGVDLNPVKRGSRYAALGQVASPEIVNGAAITKNKGALAHRDKRQKFTDLVPFSLVEAGPRMEMAVLMYYREVDDRLDQHDDPNALWKWAQEQAEKRLAEINKKTPAEEFLAFGQRQMARISTLPEDEQKRTRDAYHRYINWLSKHSEDPKLTTTDPIKIWVQAYINVVNEEVTTASRKSQEELKEKRREEAWKKAEAKFGDVITFAEKRIFPATPTRGITLDEEQLSETTNEPVKVGYLIQASTAEKIIRNKIASDFLHSVLDRMQKDPEAFNKTSVQVDFYDYLHQNPEQYKALVLTASHPDVERQEEKVDIPAWQTATEIVVGLIPYVGTGVAFYEAGTGRDLFGHPLTTTERTIIGVGALLPGIFKLLKLGKETFVASKVVKEYGLEGAEAARVYKLYTGLGPGTTGAKLFDWGYKEIMAGRKIDDPRILHQMEVVLKDLGMTDKETARVLLPAVERQAEAVAKEEVKAVKAIVGPISEDTETLLAKNPELREALKDNNLAAKVLKKCNTPCFPPGLKKEQVEQLERLLEQIKKTGPYDEDALRTFLYNNRAPDKIGGAINDVAMAASSKNVRDGTAASKLNAWLEFKNDPTKSVTKGIDQAAAQAQRKASEALGVAGGRSEAALEGKTVSNFVTPITGNQGFDDIALKGTNWDKDIIYILEHKGETARLADGQMEMDWVVKNIQRLYREGGTDGQIWAKRLAKAMNEGRLRGRGYWTYTENGKQVTEILNNGKDWIYKGKVNLGP